MNSPSVVATLPGRTKNPEATRLLLVECAFQKIYDHGYTRASVDRILSKTGLTKGAVYHHFEGKAALAHAVIDDVIRRWFVDGWVAPLEDSDDPVRTLIGTASHMNGGSAPRSDALRLPAE